MHLICDRTDDMSFPVELVKAIDLWFESRDKKRCLDCLDVKDIQEFDSYVLEEKTFVRSYCGDCKKIRTEEQGRKGGANC